MQASKIIVGVTYAIRHDDKLVRFTPEAIVTRRESAHNNPHDYTSTVEGVIPAPDNDGEPLRLTVKPDAVLGPYRQYVELVEREAAERATRDAATELRKDAARRLHQALYRVSGLKVIEGDNSWGVPYRLGSRDEDITINFNGVAALLAALNKDGEQ